MEGDVRKFVDPRLDKLGRGEAGPPPVWVDRKELTDRRFFRFGVDILRSSRREVELGVLRGVGKFLDGDGCRNCDELLLCDNAGDNVRAEVGNGVAEAAAIDRRFRPSDKSAASLVVGEGRPLGETPWR